MYSVDSGTEKVVVPDKAGVGVDDGSTGAEDPVAEVAFR